MSVFTTEQIEQVVKELNNWSFKDGFLCTTIKATNFKQAFSLMTQIAFEAEAINHHPNWSNTYNTIEIKLRTHDLDGITQNDVNLARQINRITESYNPA